jgi:hypothetical protein
MFWQWYILFSIVLLHQYMSRGRRTYLLLTILKIFFDIKNDFIYYRFHVYIIIISIPLLVTMSSNKMTGRRHTISNN